MSYFSAPQQSNLPRSNECESEQDIRVARHAYVGVARTPSEESEGDGVRCDERPEGSGDETNGTDTMDVEEPLPLPSQAFLGRKVSKRTLGICAAVFNGTWGGSIMVPMQWAP